MTRAQKILDRVSRDVGVLPTSILASYIDQFPTRAYYKTWMIPLHGDLIGALDITSQRYYEAVGTLEAHGLIRKRFDREVRKMLYAINWERLERFYVPFWVKVRNRFFSVGKQIG